VDDLESLQAAFLAAERELRAARAELSEAQADGSAFASLDGQRDRVADAVAAYAEAKRRLSELQGGSP
jgi:hypothetical protein